MKSLFKNKFLLLILVIVVAIAGWFYWGGGEDVAIPLPEDSNVEQNAAIGAEVDELLQAVNSIELDSSFFSKNTFKSLQSFELFITSSPLGRINPFADYGRSESDRVTTTQFLTGTE